MQNSFRWKHSNATDRVSQATSALQVLIGLQFLKSGFAMDMRMFTFGDPPSQDEPSRGPWALHVQCPWRLELGGQIVTGKSDWYIAASEDDALDDNTELDAAERLQQVRLHEILETRDKASELTRRNDAGFVVESVQVGAIGDLRIEMTPSLSLLVFPDGTRGEFWRLLKKGDLESHYVCGASEF